MHTKNLPLTNLRTCNWFARYNYRVAFKAHSFPWASLLENCSHPKRDNVSGTQSRFQKAQNEIVVLLIRIILNARKNFFVSSQRKFSVITVGENHFPYKAIRYISLISDVFSDFPEILRSRNRALETTHNSFRGRRVYFEHFFPNNLSRNSRIFPRQIRIRLTRLHLVEDDSPLIRK